MQDYFVEQADYQRWASTELLQALDQLSETQRQQDVELFFKTIHKTADHILVTTRNWRGQLSAACTRLGAPCPKMDFVFYCRRART